MKISARVIQQVVGLFSTETDKDNFVLYLMLCRLYFMLVLYICLEFQTRKIGVNCCLLDFIFFKVIIIACNVTEIQNVQSYTYIALDGT